MRETQPTAVKPELAAHLSDSERAIYVNTFFHHLLGSAVSEGAACFPPFAQRQADFFPLHFL